MTTYSHEQTVLRVRPGSRFFSWVLRSPQPGGASETGRVEWSSKAETPQQKVSGPKTTESRKSGQSPSNGGDCAKVASRLSRH